MPTVSATDAIVIATNDLITALKNPHPALPSLHLNNDHYKALKEITKMFNEASKPNKMELTTPVPESPPVIIPIQMKEKSVPPNETQKE